jgi:hypothetical protein
MKSLRRQFGMDAGLGWALRLGMGCALAAWAAVPCAQPPTASAAVSSTTAVPASSSGNVMREIDDPHTGEHWLLLRDPSHPGGPGRLVPAADSRSANSLPANSHRDSAPKEKLAKDESLDLREKPAAQPVERKLEVPGSSRLQPVLRAGDSLIVEEHTAILDAQWEAVALNPAAAGSVLQVRLKIGGKIVIAIATGPGRAELRAERTAAKADWGAGQ